MLKILKQEGFASLVEIIISSIIFIIAAFGIFSSISMLRPQGNLSTKRLEAAYIGKGIIDQLHAHLMGNTWDDPTMNLYPGVVHSQTIGEFTVNYFTEDVPGLGLRKLHMNIEYPD